MWTKLTGLVLDHLEFADVLHLHMMTNSAKPYFARIVMKKLLEELCMGHFYEPLIQCGVVSIQVLQDEGLISNDELENRIGMGFVHVRKLRRRLRACLTPATPIPDPAPAATAPALAAAAPASRARPRAPGAPPVPPKSLSVTNDRRPTDQHAHHRNVAYILISCSSCRNLDELRQYCLKEPFLLTNLNVIASCVLFFWLVCQSLSHASKHKLKQPGRDKSLQSAVNTHFALTIFIFTVYYSFVYKQNHSKALERHLKILNDNKLWLFELQSALSHGCIIVPAISEFFTSTHHFVLQTLAYDIPLLILCYSGWNALGSYILHVPIYQISFFNRDFDWRLSDACVIFFAAYIYLSVFLSASKATPMAHHALKDRLLELVELGQTNADCKDFV
ncbi:hypothetical protein AURANDRAFT_68556 [Aureococcus anophagefferens]|uniref:Uncharacterized protein n=1 Tax=Aureococcus anophagefferens TaxID=44056 RepID=F0YQ10_AURAN|nr:hypothetical protein AURANDRAFT_68556 [Aureococcus anophagefferens]EGB02796.1 hypothetical protein AURANDRAFT_68556 [Aureococcus anophagefferens]|eukprot:XP_009042502.1 hypothetical protein AURANDRAFT_68556 [Aureococcus anophagefferens]